MLLFWIQVESENKANSISPTGVGTGTELGNISILVPVFSGYQAVWAVITLNRQLHLIKA